MPLLTFHGFPLIWINSSLRTQTKRTMSNQVQAFREHRERTNDLILSKQNKVINRLFNLDTNVYQEGALAVKTKELLGLVSSMVLKCDDCVFYHLGRCHEEGVTTEEIYETFAVANVVGGTIIIPHTRRAADYWEELQKGQENTPTNSEQDTPNEQ